MRENADVEGFTIDEKHMKELDALDERLVTDWYAMTRECAWDDLLTSVIGTRLRRHRAVA